VGVKLPLSGRQAAVVVLVDGMLENRNRRYRERKNCR